MSVMYIRNEQTGEFEPVPSLVGPQGPPGSNGDGAGTVTAVHGVTPDTTGNVELAASDVGARPDDWTPTAEDVGALPSGGTAVNANALNGKDASEYLLKSGAFTMDLLWTNASVDSNFDAQTINLDLSKYQFVMLVVYSQICGDTIANQLGGAIRGTTSEIIKVGEAASLGYIHPYGSNDELLAVRQRCVQVRTDGIVFATARFMYLDSTFRVEESPTSCKPYRIYGIKGVTL